MKEKNRNMILGIVVLLIVLGIGVRVNWIVYQRYNDGCDEKYGAGNWETVEITGTEEAPKFFIGQSWKCVEK